MESAYLKTLLEVVKAGSFSKAADCLCVTQSAVSRRVKFMEEQYGIPLIDRTGPLLLPTDAGKVVIDKASRMLELEQELLKDIQCFTEKPGITFCSTPAFGIAYLPKVMNEFMLANADLADLKFLFGMPENVVEGLQEGIYDVGVVEHCECLDIPELSTFPLPDDTMIFVSAPGLGIEKGETSIDELIKHPLYSRQDGCCSRKFLNYNMNCIERSIDEFRRIVIYDDLHLIIRSVAEAMGITFISRAVVEKELLQGKLIEHKVNGFQHDRNRTLIIPPELTAKQAVQCFVNAICNVFELPPFKLS